MASKPFKIFRGAIRANKENTLPLDALRRMLPRKPHFYTILQWVKFGRINRETDERVQMEAVQGTAGLESSVEAYERFIDRLNEE